MFDIKYRSSENNMVGNFGNEIFNIGRDSMFFDVLLFIVKIWDNIIKV